MGRILDFNNPICLTESDLVKIKREAYLRNTGNRADGIIDQRVMDDSIGIDMIGSACEYAIVKNYNCEWTGSFPARTEFVENKRKVVAGNPDALMDTSIGEVRGTYHFKRGGLIIHEKDRNEWPYILVQQENLNTYHAIGWCYGYEAKLDEWWNDRLLKKPSYLVPQESTRPMNTLPIKET